MSTQTPMTPATVGEYVQQAIDIIEYSLANKIKPMVAIVVQHREGQWIGAFMCLYAAESKADPDGKQTMPLTPYFYSYEVATILVQMGVLLEEHESQKTGIQVHWCRVLTVGKK